MQREDWEIEVFKQILRELEDVKVAQEIEVKYDNGFNSFSLPLENRVCGEAELRTIIAQFMDHMHHRVITPGGHLSFNDGVGRVETMFNSNPRRHEGDMATHLGNCMVGLRGGVRHVLTIICDSLKNDAIQNYRVAVLRKYLPRDNHAMRMRVMGALLNWYPKPLPGIDRDHPEYYLGKLEEVVEAMSDGLDRAASSLRVPY